MRPKVISSMFAEVGLTPPDLFALGARIGVLTFSRRSKATG